jgi:magnesium transporter
MLRILLDDALPPQPVTVAAGWRLPDGAIWLDLLNPTREEELAAEEALGLSLPTREEMAEIETSSRLYRDDGAIFMTASILAHSDAPVPQIGPVTFVLTKARVLVTIRYIEPRAFTLFHQQLDRDPAACATGAGVLLALLDVLIDRLADVLEKAVAEVESMSTAVFHRPDKIDFRGIMDRLGKAQGVNAKIRESAASLMRMLIYAGGAEAVESEGAREHISSLQHDLASVTDHSGYLAGNITFLLDAALGLINIEQNAIIKFFSVAAVVFLPPTLVASYFGMNFKHMAEFDWITGEPMALCLMIVSVVVPLVWFRRKGWL